MEKEKKNSFSPPQRCDSFIYFFASFFCSKAVAPVVAAQVVTARVAPRRWPRPVLPWPLPGLASFLFFPLALCLTSAFGVFWPSSESALDAIPLDAAFSLSTPPTPAHTLTPLPTPLTLTLTTVTASTSEPETETETETAADLGKWLVDDLRSSSSSSCPPSVFATLGVTGVAGAAGRVSPSPSPLLVTGAGWTSGLESSWLLQVKTSRPSLLAAPRVFFSISIPLPFFLLGFGMECGDSWAFCFFVCAFSHFMPERCRLTRLLLTPPPDAVFQFQTRPLAFSRLHFSDSLSLVSREFVQSSSLMIFSFDCWDSFFVYFFFFLLPSVHYFSFLFFRFC